MLVVLFLSIGRNLPKYYELKGVLRHEISQTISDGSGNSLGGQAYRWKVKNERGLSLGYTTCL
jgi:hypothetical protein